MNDKATRGWVFWLGVAGAIATLLALGVAIVVALFGDNLVGGGGGAEPPAGSRPDSSSSLPTAKGKLLSDGPVKVYWTGEGETLEVRWEPMSYPELNNYSVDTYGLYPEESWVNDGYRRGEELDTYRVIHPVADTRTYNSDAKVSSGESWRICVTGMRETPGGVDVTPYVIKGSKRCSDTFTVPE